MDTSVLHMTRGTLNVQTLDEACAMHNAFVTGGEPPGIEIARALGDLSHNVYTPAEHGGALVGAATDELVFIDYWADPAGMEEFFASPFVQTAGDELYASREDAEWLPAPGAFTFHVPPPAGAAARFIGMMRAPADSADEAIAQLGKLVWTNLSAARRRGQLSHALYVRTADLTTTRPASNSRRTAGEAVAASAHPVEVFAIDSWSTLEGLLEHYDDATAMSGLDSALAGPPAASVWEPASGFSEW